MATRVILAPYTWLEGYKAGVEMVNDGAIQVVSFERLGPFNGELILEDRDAEEDHMINLIDDPQED